MSIWPLTSDERYRLLSICREGMGEREYSKMVNELGEDYLLRQLILTVPSLGERIEENRRHLENLKIQAVEQSRAPSAKAAAKTGILAGGAFLVFAWLLHLIWEVPYWTSMAPLVNGVLPVLIVAGLIYWRADKVKIKITYKPLLISYIVIVALGSIIGAGRWGAGSLWSVKTWIEALLGITAGISQYIGPGLIILSIVLWLIEKTIKKELSFRSIVNLGMNIDDYLTLFLGLTISFFLYCVAILIDASHFTPWIFGETEGVSALVNLYPYVVIPVLCLLVGIILGYLIPTRYYDVH
jgi:hypothetical protein